MGAHHIIPAKTFLNVLIALLILTIITVAVAQFDFGAFNFVIAMGVASAKAALVMMYFMHLKYDDKTYTVLMGTSVFFLFVFFFFSQLDIVTRIFEGSTL